MEVLRGVLQQKESGEYMEENQNYMAYYLPVTPKNVPIKDIVIHNDTGTGKNIGFGDNRFVASRSRSCGEFGFVWETCR